MSHPVTIGAFAIIVNEQKQVLLVHRCDHDLWDLPGGSMEQGESPWQAVVRETREEAGFEVMVDRLVGIYSDPVRNIIAFSFECRIVGGTLTLNSEARDIQYFNFESIPKNIPPKKLERISDYFFGNKELILKIQDGPTAVELLKEGRL